MLYTFQKAAFAVGIICATSLTASADTVEQNTTVHHFEDQSVIDHADAKLTRMDHGVSVRLHTHELTPGDAVTLWYVVFNTPAGCAGACGEDDVFHMDAEGKFVENGDGTPPFNLDAHEKTGLSILRADGVIIDADGKAEFRGHLPVGDVTEAIIGDGLLDTLNAEVHVVVRSHQQVQPGIASEMITSINGGCNSEWPNAPCADLQFAVFMPAS